MVLFFFHLGFTLCPVKVSVDDHSMLIISSDSADIVPQTVSSFVIHNGER
jgi:hypothetical protein